MADSRGERTQRRAAARSERGRVAMQVPEHIRAMAAGRPRRPPCPIFGWCRRDHLKRKAAPA